jgi:hypothetical protein
MENCKSIGTPNWTREEMIASLDEFVTLYQERPIQDNTGGMKAPHLFAVWFMVRKLAPELIVESGVWKGQGTWLLEQACPSARVVSIDPDLSKRIYISKRVVYTHLDFSLQDWTDLPEKSVVLFDDHQNAYRRLQQCHWFGFKHVIFEDNYPVSQGDCYSLKKAFSQSGFESPRTQWKLTFRERIFRRMIYSLNAKLQLGLLIQSQHIMQESIPPNLQDRKMLESKLALYYEFPPVVIHSYTRWGDQWELPNYPTPHPLIESSLPPHWQMFEQDAEFYNWICYVKLK